MLRAADASIFIGLTMRFPMATASASATASAPSARRPISQAVVRAAPSTMSLGTASPIVQSPSAER